MAQNANAWQGINSINNTATIVQVTENKAIDKITDAHAHNQLFMKDQMIHV